MKLDAHQAKIAELLDRLQDDIKGKPITIEMIKDAEKIVEMLRDLADALELAVDEYEIGETCEGLR